MRGKISGVMTSISAVGLLVLLAVAPLVIIAELKADSGAVVPSEILEITVQPGDTLWSIAKANVPKKDPRDVIAAVRVLNQLNSAEIFPGQTLRIEIPKAIRLAEQAI
ncbi:MAG TPA: LysM peptidoglycan-binding domain-containing protein [Firmicutes bacterium]|nr:LysM peptidoglycan-binding domain-containing protein [Bacillota bacterium]